MKKLIIAHSVDPDACDETFNLPLPNQCPICSVAYSNIPLNAYYIKNRNSITGSEQIIYATYFCPHCELFFSVKYEAPEYLYDSQYSNGYILCIYPSSQSTHSFSEQIEKISPKFVEIYHQSELAENAGLLDICGMGYRKSLEFLIKDYAISLMPDKESEICISSLSQCINNFIESPHIKSLAKASAWIGNDETHYIRKHQNYTVNDLKRFIKTTVAYIEYELNYAEASALLSSPQ